MLSSGSLFSRANAHAECSLPFLAKWAIPLKSIESAEREASTRSDCLTIAILRRPCSVNARTFFKREADGKLPIKNLTEYGISAHTHSCHYQQCITAAFDGTRNLLSRNSTEHSDVTTKLQADTIVCSHYN